MFRARILGFNLVVLFVNNAFCHEQHFVTEKVDRSHEKLKTAVNQFGIQLYRRLSSEGRNVFFSPFSLSTALSMAFLGARTKTATEMSSVLGFRKAGLAREDVPDSFYKAFQLLKSDQTKDHFYVANTALVQVNYNILNSYKIILQKKFHSDIQPVDFVGNGIAVKESVNKWVSNQTHNKITSLIDKPLSHLTRLFLLNAVYFKGTWKTQFERKKTTTSLFYDNKKIARSVQMMSLTSKFLYTYDSKLKCQVLELPYDGDKTSMIFILPEWDVGLEHVENTLSPESLNQLINNLQDTEVVVTIPKFKLEDSPQIKEYLRAMGMNEAFSLSADFSGMSGRRDLFVKDVLHKAVIDVNEEGSEAAAVSGIVMILESASYNLATFVANRPFMFLIRKRESGIILFMGSVKEL